MKVETVVGTLEAGSVAAKIAKFAEDGNYNLIIMGTKDPTDLKALVTGSLAHAVVRAAHCPVLLVKKLRRKHWRHWANRRLDCRPSGRERP